LSGDGSFRLPMTNVGPRAEIYAPRIPAFYLAIKRVNAEFRNFETLDLRRLGMNGAGGQQQKRKECYQAHTMLHRAGSLLSLRPSIIAVMWLNCVSKWDEPKTG
jgi:hypothetical protein